MPVCGRSVSVKAGGYALGSWDVVAETAARDKHEARPKEIHRSSPARPRCAGVDNGSVWSACSIRFGPESGRICRRYESSACGWIRPEHCWPPVTNM